MLRRLIQRLAGERGFTMAPMMGGLLAILFIGMATAALVDGDTKPSLADRDRKQALAAAEAGVQDYLSRLKVNPDYWTLCNAAGNPALNTPRPAEAARGWSAPLPGTTARYSIELLPVRDETGTDWAACSTTDPQRSVIDATGTFRIRSTGEASAGSRQRRSVIATFQPQGLLQYIYFTEFETFSPALYERESWGNPTRGRAQGAGSNYQTIRDWAAAPDTCSQTYYSADGSDGRRNKYWSGDEDENAGMQNIMRSGGGFVSDSGWHDWTQYCAEIQFAGDDEIRGPMHTNDSILICGSPQFGERATDRIEVNGPGDGWRGCNSSATPNKVGTWVPNAGRVTLPETNSALEEDANLRFLGATSLRFDQGSIVVTGREADGTDVVDKTYAVNDGDVIYVADDPNRSCGTRYNPVRPYVVDPGCGIVQVQGTYARSLTVGAESDVVIRENVVRANDGVVLGLIATQWIRVWHDFRVLTDDPNARAVGCQTNAHLGDVQIDAALLSLQHSFTVDGYFCGPNKLGTLTVRGAIAQQFRGPVGTGGGGSSGTGYIKNYEYDRRLQFRQPPRFLDPALPNWGLRSMTEQVPAETPPAS